MARVGSPSQVYCIAWHPNFAGWLHFMMWMALAWAIYYSIWHDGWALHCWAMHWSVAVELLKPSTGGYLEFIPEFPHEQNLAKMLPFIIQGQKGKGPLIWSIEPNTTNPNPSKVRPIPLWLLG